MTVPPSKNKGASDVYINVSASLASAALDSIIFHPLETYVRRLQLNESVLPHLKMQRLAHVSTNASSLFQGMVAANVLKGAHRSFKYAGEPLIAHQFKVLYPEGDPVVLHTLGGAATGILTAIVLTPLDTLKVKKQRSHHGTVSYQRLWMAQTTHPYHAVKITLIRNSLGTAAFFACNSYLMHHVFRLDENDMLTGRQKLVNSLLCPFLGILVSYPADLIKTHIQAAEKNAYGVVQAVQDLTAKGGVKALYRGLVPKLVTLAPRASVSYFLYQSLQDQFRLYAHHKKSALPFFNVREEGGAGYQSESSFSLPSKRP